VPGWESQFVEYFTARHGALRRLAFGLCGDWHAADDAVAHTFTQLYRHWPRVRPESKDAYARQILVNALRSHRHRRRGEVLTTELPDSAMPEVDAGGRLDLHRALARLPRRQREMVVLRYLEDLPVCEVAVILRVAEGTVKSQTARGIEALRRLLDARTEEAHVAARGGRLSWTSGSS
jgi:RNA polymerase sigma-70 factor (sigma-E family)